jgi:DNA-binding SARP family transcriptional activator
MSVLHVSFLGGPTLAWGNVPLPPPAGVAARSLFAYLVTYRDRARTRDLPDTVARRRLSRALWLIRRCLQTQGHPRPILAGASMNRP